MRRWKLPWQTCTCQAARLQDRSNACSWESGRRCDGRSDRPQEERLHGREGSSSLQDSCFNL
eukprot:751314-Hanusia_phi.AAC.2